MMFRFIRKSLLWLLLAPWIISGAGVASNQLVLIANHGKFPVMTNPVQLADFRIDDAKTIDATGMFDSIHCVMTKDTRLNFLADIFARQDGFYSIGDGLLEASAASKDYFIFLWVILMVQKVNAKRDDLIFRS